MEDFKQAIDLLEDLKMDSFAPRSVRLIAEEAINILKGKDDERGLCIDKVIQILDKISNDPNIDMGIRTKVWGIVSVLEAQ